MVERTANTVSFGLLDTERRRINAVAGEAESHNRGIADRIAVRAHTADDVTRSTVGITSREVDAVAGAGRQVLEREGELHGEAPGIARDTRSTDRLARTDLVSRSRHLEQTPGLVDTDLTDDVRSIGAAPVVGSASNEGSSAEADAEVIQRSTGVGVDAGNNAAASIQAAVLFQADRSRHAIAELGGVGDLVDTGHVVLATEEERGVVARIAGPRSRELRHRLTEGEAGELDERVVDAEVTEGARVAVRGPVEHRIEVGADHAVFGGGTRIDVDVLTGAGDVIVIVTIRSAHPARHVIGAGAVERHVGTQVAAQLDAGIGARDVVETRAVQRADLHVFDRLGLQRKIGRLCPADSDQGRCRAEDKALNHLHVNLQVCSQGKVPYPLGETPEDWFP